MAEGYPAERFSIAAVAPKQAAALIRFGHHPDRDAKARGEEDARLYGLDAWHESPLYGERERAALALCETVTRIDRAGVPDDVWAEAQRHFDQGELAGLLCAIAAINAWNRLSIATRALPGDYSPADREAAGTVATG